MAFTNTLDKQSERKNTVSLPNEIERFIFGIFPPIADNSQDKRIFLFILPSTIWLLPTAYQDKCFHNQRCDTQRNLLQHLEWCIILIVKFSVKQLLTVVKPFQHQHFGNYKFHFISFHSIQFNSITVAIA